MNSFDTPPPKPGVYAVIMEKPSRRHYSAWNGTYWTVTCGAPDAVLRRHTPSSSVPRNVYAYWEPLTEHEIVRLARGALGEQL